MRRIDVTYDKKSGECTSRRYHNEIQKLKHIALRKEVETKKERDRRRKKKGKRKRNERTMIQKDR